MNFQYLNTEERSGKWPGGEFFLIMMVAKIIGVKCLLRM